MRIINAAQLQQAFSQLTIFRSLHNTAAGRALQKLLESAQGPAVRAAWCALEAVRLETRPLAKDFPALLEQLLLGCENCVTLAWERGETPPVENGRLLYETGLLLQLASLPERLVESGDLPLPEVPSATVFHTAQNSAGLEALLARRCREEGCGLFRTHRMAAWCPERKPHLRGALSPDPVQLADLWGYEEARSRIIANIRALLDGAPAHNMLLYGARGSGKSATIKALVNGWYGRGLRLIEADSSRLETLPQLLEMLQPRGLKFIILLDDLSFDRDNTAFRHLKSILEGGISVRPANTVICVTTNRRRLVRQFFRDRQMDDEVNEQDTMEEQLALSDRFGLTVTFTAPDQEAYLAIAAHILERRGICLPEEELRSRALRWERTGHGRSGRTARQFADQVTAELSSAATGPDHS